MSHCSEARDLMSECFDKNTIDEDEYTDLSGEPYSYTGAGPSRFPK